ncbi:hypothetical protein EK904_012013 [Melospiza melodia maxima]
MLSHN